jgi:hypothetical protein
MTPEKFEEVKEAYIEHITDMMADMSGIYPHITLFGDMLNPKPEDEGKPAIIHIPIPESYMENDNKHEFIEDLMPSIYKDLKKDFSIYAVAWASEAWMRTVSKENPELKSPKKKEILILTIGTEKEEEVIIYEMKRKGKQVNKSGDLVDIIELILLPENDGISKVSGTFAGLFKKFNK